MNINSINMEIDDISNDNEYNKFTKLYQLHFFIVAITK